MESKKICVLGAGISGLVQALFNQEKGHSVCILDEGEKVGGVLKSKQENGYLLDFGANTFSLRKKEIQDFLTRYDVLDHAWDANLLANKRFIVRNGKLVSLPQSFFSFFTSSFLSPLGKLRLLAEPFIPRREEKTLEESVGCFIKRRFGQEVLSYAANPFIGGIYAAKPETLSVKHAFPSVYEKERKYGSVFRGFFKERKNATQNSIKTRLISFKNGMSEMPERLSQSLNQSPLLRTSIKEVRCLPNEKWNVISEKSNGNQINGIFDEIFCTLPSHRLNNINWINLNNQELLEDLTKVVHPPLSLVYLGYKRKQIRHPLDGFGFLVPEVEKFEILGTLFSSTLFPNRAPKDKILLTSFVGGERNPELCDLSEKKIIELTIRENKKFLGIDGPPDFTKVIHWKESIPLPDLTMNCRLKAAKGLEKNNRGLFFGGSYISGPPLPNCIIPAYRSPFD